MNRQQATAILRELMIECDGALLGSSVSLTTTQLNNYSIDMHVQLDDTLRKCINRVLKKHQLAMKEHTGKVTISN
jgi:hypothetical protein